MATKPYPTGPKPTVKLPNIAPGAIYKGELPPPAYQKWEYKQLDFAGGANVYELNGPGLDGWELIGFLTNAADLFTYIFKRPL